MQEFDVIARYFSWDTIPTPGVRVGVGDDAAVLDVPPGKQLVTSIDTLISDVHFPENTDAYLIGYKALAVNLSDLAAMGASPAWFTLALSLPEIDTQWLEHFSLGLKTLAKQYDIALVGGDTTRGPLSISIQVMGLVDTGRALLRSGAKAGDKIYVTGTLGNAAAGLQSIFNMLDLPKKDRQFCETCLNQPVPRLAEGLILKDYASSCIDVSDGLLQDLSHLLRASAVGAKLDTAALPLSPSLLKLDRLQSLHYALSGGDDYELLFTLAEDKEARLFDNTPLQATCIGVITAQTNTIVDQNLKQLKPAGYNHFHV